MLIPYLHNAERLAKEGESDAEVVSEIMAFILPIWDGQKRVKYVGPDGTQLPQEDRSWHWLQADLTQKFAQVPRCLPHSICLDKAVALLSLPSMHARWQLS